MIEYNKINWIKYKNFMLSPYVSPHISINLSKNDSKELITKSGAKLLRWVSDWDSPKEGEFWYTIKDSFGGLEELSGNTRSKVRRGLKNCVIKTVNQEHSKEIYEVIKAAFEGYGETIHYTYKEFLEEFEKLSSEAGREFWGVFETESDTLIAYAQCKIQDNACQYYYVKFNPQYLKLYPSYALYYSLGKHYLEEKKLSYVSNGAKTINHETNVHALLIDKLKYRKAYCKLNIEYSTKVNVLITLLYPFRNLINKIKNSKFKALYSLLLQEEIKRSYE